MEDIFEEFSGFKNALPVGNVFPCSLEEIYKRAKKKMRIFRNVYDAFGYVLFPLMSFFLINVIMFQMLLIVILCTLGKCLECFKLEILPDHATEVSFLLTSNCYCRSY